MSAPPRTAVGGIPLIAGARLPLAFITLGLAALVGATAWLAWQPALLFLPHVHPSVAALAHFWLPGFLLSVCLGAVYQLMPVVLGAPLQLPLRAAWVHLALHAIGVAVLVAGFALGRFALVGAGGTAIAIGIAIFCVATWRTFLFAARRDAIGWSFPLAATWLGVTVLVGVLLAINRHAPFLPLSVIDLLQAHAHLGLAGFFVTLLQGATFQLVPMFTMADLRRPGLITAGLVLTQVGLLALAPALGFGFRSARIIGACTLAAGIGCSGVALVATFRSRRRRVIEPGLRAFALGAGLLGATTCGGVVLALVHGGAAQAAIAAYGATAIAGALSFMVLGMLCKIVPFLVWMRTYGPLAGRRPVPLATALGSKRLELGWLSLHATALLALLAGLGAGSATLVTIGTSLLLIAVLVFVTNIARVGTHLLRPQEPAAAAPRAPAIPS